MTTRPAPITVALVCALSGLLFPIGSTAQSEKPWELPQELRPAMEGRLTLFMKAQADGRWEDVAQFLGAYRRGWVRYLSYTAAHKACLISQMQASPMVASTFSVQESPFSSEILSTPPGRRWWTLVGEAVFRDGSGEVKRRSSIIAYRDRGEWYFTPQNIDDKAWAQAHLSAGEITADRADEVIRNVALDCPVAIVDLHVFVRPEAPSSRRVEFRLNNKSEKRITGYSFEIGSERGDGSIGVGTGAPQDAIEPRGLSRKWEEDFAAYTYWCEGESRMSIEVQSVSFADGTTWNAPSLSPNRDEDQ